MMKSFIRGVKIIWSSGPDGKIYLISWPIILLGIIGCIILVSVNIGNTRDAVCLGKCFGMWRENCTNVRVLACGEDFVTCEFTGCEKGEAEE